MKKWIAVSTLAVLSAAALVAQAPAGKNLGWAFPTATMVVNKPPLPGRSKYRNERRFDGPHGRGWNQLGCGPNFQPV